MKKNSKYCLLAWLSIIILLALVSCSDSPTDPTPSPSIIGTWSQVYEDPTYHYTMTFLADGTGSDWAMHDGDPETTNTFTYAVSSNTITITYDSGGFFSGIFTLGETTMTVDMGGTIIVFNRVE